ncbi:MAG: hypothetical protein AVDCRST_MAG49-4619, partial [uncultured Thermomicrobiales bacterium]
GARVRGVPAPRRDDRGRRRRRPDPERGDGREARAPLPGPCRSRRRGGDQAVRGLGRGGEDGEAGDRRARARRARGLPLHRCRLHGSAQRRRGPHRAGRVGPAAARRIAGRVAAAATGAGATCDAAARPGRLHAGRALRDAGDGGAGAGPTGQGRGRANLEDGRALRRRPGSHAARDGGTRGERHRRRAV